MSSKKIDLSAYLVIGPENTKGRPLGDIVEAAVAEGFTCVQLRSKICSARELIECCREAAEAIARIGDPSRVKLLVDDRLDVALAARDAGIKLDGIHVGQSDIPFELCRTYLGEEAIIGLTAPSTGMLEYVQAFDSDAVDYLGIGPLRQTETKQDCGLDEDGYLITKTLAELAELAQVSSVPLVVGGGVKLSDIPDLATTGLDGFFVVSAVCGAENPQTAARDLVQAWRSGRQGS